MKQRKQTMDDILRRLGFYEEEAVEEIMLDEEAIRLIQIHERARQGRLRSQFMREIRLLKEKGYKKFLIFKRCFRLIVIPQFDSWVRKASYDMKSLGNVFD